MLYLCCAHPQLCLVFVEAQTQHPQDGGQELDPQTHLEVIKDAPGGGGGGGGEGRREGGGGGGEHHFFPNTQTLSFHYGKSELKVKKMFKTNS